MLTLAVSARCQTLADYQFSTGNDASRWYTLDSTRNILVTGSSYYLRSQLENIGFTFPFADTSYTTFSATLAGDLRLGAVALTSGSTQGSPFHRLRANLNKPKINFFGCTGYASDSAYVRRQVFGSAPDRVLVVEFALQTYNTSSRAALFRYQVQLHENGDIQIVYPSQPPVRMPAPQRMQGLCVDSSDVLIVDSLHVVTHHTNGNSTYVAPGYWPDTNRYYRFNFPFNVCPAPQGLVAAQIDTTSVTLSWRNPNYINEFAVEYNDVMFIPGTGSGTALTTSDTAVTIQGLQRNHQYHFFVRPVCSEGDTGNAAYIAVRTATKSPVSDFPYLCDFESADERDNWFIAQGNINTQWYIDSAVNNTTGGAYALYISQDSGLTNTGGDQWIGAYAYRDLNLAAGDWSIAFDWRAYGDWTSTTSGQPQYFHFLRAFLVPSFINFTVQTPASFPASPHDSAVPSGWINLVPQSNALAGQTSWTTHQATVTVPASGCYHLVFYWETDGYPANIDSPAAIDNISVEHILCPQPRNLTATATQDEIQLNWQRGSNENQWMVRYGSNEVFVNDTFYLAAGLDFNTVYSFDVYSICGAGDTSFATSATVRTANLDPVGQLPYLCDFEDTVENRKWVMQNQGQTNAWHIGSAANATAGGSKALYISQDSGATNTYSGAAFSLAYAFRTFRFDIGDYLCTFDWRCVGDADFHFLRAFIVPQSTIPEAGTFPPSSNHYADVPQGWTDLIADSHTLSGQSSWTSQTATFSISDTGTYALLFMWENDQYTPSNPPAAVDNIVVEAYSCHIPSGLTASASQDYIDLVWVAGDDANSWLVQYADTTAIAYTPSYSALNLSPNSEYSFSVRALCYSGDTSLAATLTTRTSCLPISTLPYSCDFDDLAVGLGSGESFVPCWTRALNYAAHTPTISANVTPGNNYLYFNLVAGQQDTVCAALPALDDNIDAAYTELRFDAMRFNMLDMYEIPFLEVGVMDDPGNIYSFSPVDTMTIANDSTFTHYAIPLLSYSGSGKYVAFRCIVSGTNFAFAACLIDNVELHEVLVCRAPQAVTAAVAADSITLQWTPGGNEQTWIVSYSDTILSTAEPRYVARGLEPNTEYQFAIASVCSFGDTSSALVARLRTDSVVVTPPADTVCQTPTAVSYYQDSPWADNAYKFHFRWTGTAPLYRVAITNQSSGTEHLFEVSDTTYYFDAEGAAGIWTMCVRALCDETNISLWSDTIEFDTPLCVGVGASADAGGSITLYPNPSSGSATLTLERLRGRVEISIVDLWGRVVMRKEVNCGVGDLKEELIRGLASGTYYVRISSPTLTAIRKLIVK